MPGLEDQIAARMSDSIRSNNHLHAAMNEQYRATIAQAMAHARTTYIGVGMPPQARQMMIDNLRRALLYMPDPAQRQMMIRQYRTMGLDITAEELGL